jgi:hypothetical protein
MTKKYYLLKSIASLLAMIFGFSATVSAQYGVMETTYKIDGNINELLSNIPIEGIKVSMKSKEIPKITAQSDSLMQLEIELQSPALDSTYFITSEDIDGAVFAGKYLPKDTLLLGTNEYNAEDPTEECTLTEVYPNPTHGIVEIVIDAKLGEEISLQLLDDSYKLMFERTVQLQAGVNHFQVDLKSYSAGNYFLVVIRRDNRMVKKIIKL